jgi:hypothetical protein
VQDQFELESSRVEHSALEPEAVSDWHRNGIGHGHATITLDFWRRLEMRASS